MTALRNQHPAHRSEVKRPMPTDESRSLHELEVEVQAELALAESSEPQTPGTSPAEWLFDPADVEREEVGLRNLLSAVEALELDSPPTD